LTTAAVGDGEEKKREREREREREQTITKKACDRRCSAYIDHVNAHSRGP